MDIIETATGDELERAHPASSNLGNSFRDIPYCLIVTDCELMAAQ